MSLVQEIGVAAGSPTIEIDGVRLAYSREGSGQAVVCLHAIGHGGRDFDAFVRAVGRAFEIIRIDWPSQGRSGPDKEPPTPARYAVLLQGVVKALNIERPIILGNSIGGATAIVYASINPVRALVLCNPGGLVEATPFVARVCNAFARFFDAGARRAWWFKRAFSLYYRFFVLSSGSASAQRRRIVAAAYDIAPVLRDAWRGFGAPAADIRATAKHLDIPVWFAWATGDQFVRLKDAMPTIKEMRQATVTRFSGKHAPFLERPRKFAKAFRAFAGSLGS
jgi:pimeloyl-ACP methyl ester carboxylesterase